MLRPTFILSAVVCGTLLGAGAAFAADADTTRTPLAADLHQPVTRVDFTVLVVRNLYGQEVTDGCFQDLSPSEYNKLFGDVSLDAAYARELCVAMHAGLINGNRDANFRPNQVITVAEASKILGKAYGLVYPSLQPTNMPWYWSYTLAMRNRGAIDADRKASSLLTLEDVDRMFTALRNQERYPLRREVGSAPVAAEKPRTVAVPKSASIAARLEKRVAEAQASGEQIILENPSDPETIVRTRHAERISRRELLRRMGEETAVN
jgi:hypothetical protein